MADKWQTNDRQMSKERQMTDKCLTKDRQMTDKWQTNDRHMTYLRFNILKSSICISFVCHLFISCLPFVNCLSFVYHLCVICMACVCHVSVICRNNWQMASTWQTNDKWYTNCIQMTRMTHKYHLTEKWHTNDKELTDKWHTTTIWQTNDILMTSKWHTNDRHIPFVIHMSYHQEARKKDMLLAWRVAQNYLNIRQLHAFRICIYLYIHSYIYIYIYNCDSSWKRNSGLHDILSVELISWDGDSSIQTIDVLANEDIKCWFDLQRWRQQLANHNCPGIDFHSIHNKQLACNMVYTEV